MYIFGGTKRFHQRCTFDVPKAQPKRRHVACCGVSSERIPLRLPLPTGNAGGLCEKFQSDVALQLTSDYTGRVSLNTGIVTFVNKNVRVPHRISEVTFAHELGHSFGAQHDPPECVPGASVGNFLMFASASHGTMPNNRRFSMCSIRDMSAVLMQMFSGQGSRSNCLQELQGPFCGNSIREDDEECDCGFDWSECRELCCYPREHGQLNRKGCTLRPDAKCSPSNSACCSDSCQYHNATWVCRHDDDCRFEAYCEYPYMVLGGKCPPSEHKRDGVLCNHRSQVCQGGECAGSLCRLYDLEECYLTGPHRTPDEMCLIACRENVSGSVCMEACHFERMKDFCNKKLEPGAPCDNLRGYCDVFQRCRLVDAEGPLARLHWLVFGGRGLQNLLVSYWYFTLLAVMASAGATALFIRLCAVHTPSSNPNLKQPRKITETVLKPMSLLRA
ncbi:hypothetical protein MTO96_047858 [Rhipicephalus appendiculatus]